MPDRTAGSMLRWMPLLLALLVATLLQQPASAQTAPVRVAVIGLVHGHVDGFLSALPKHPGIELVGIVEPDTALAAGYETKYSLPHALFFTDADRMIASVHPQALLVYTSPAGHRAAIETAARHGLTVMVEKPLTISLSDALAIRRIAREKQIHVLVNYVTTWAPANHAVYDEAISGRLGTIRRIVVHTGHQGPAEIGVGPAFLGWLTDPAQNGAGALYDFGCYGAVLSTWIMQGKPPLSVTAVVNHDKPQTYPKVEDDATIVLAYPGAQSVIQASWNWPFSRSDMEVYGATGYAIATDSTALRLRHQHDAAEQTAAAAPLPAPQNDPLNYLTAVLNGQIEPKGDLSALDTNVVVMQILDAARESARTGKTVTLAPLSE